MAFADWIHFGSSFGRLLIAAGLTLLAAPHAGADVLVLKNGGQLHGRWLNADERPVSHYLIQTEQGGRLRLAAEQVKEAIRQSESQRRYEQQARRLPDTVADHWKAAEWCRERRLNDERTHHLQRIIELDPEHVAARRALGYTQLHGQWTRREDYQAERGYTLYRGRYRTRQEIALMEERAASETARREWIVRLRRWREDLASDSTSATADRFRAIDDPYAVEAVTQLLEAERYRPVKMLLLDVLRQIETPAAIAVIVDRSLNDRDEEVFHACIERVLPLKTPEVIRAYVEGLGDENNVKVNRAGYALGQLGDPSTIAPLIEALTTHHKLTIPGNRRASADTITSTFSQTNAAGAASFGGSGLSMGDGSGTRIVEVSNQGVLEALARLSGGSSFGFDKRAWRAWHAVELKNGPRLDGRRD